MQIERKLLISALEFAKPALATAAGSVQQLKHVWLDGKYLYAYDGSLGIRLSWATELQPCGIPSAVLLALLHCSTAEEVTLKQEGSPVTQLAVKMGRSSATIPLLDSDSNPWPFPVKVPAGGKTILNLTKELRLGLKQASIIKASNPSRAEHYGVVLFPGAAAQGFEDFLALYAINSKALIEVTVKGSYAKELRGTILPYAFVARLLALDEATPIKLHILKDALIAEGDDVQVCSNLLDSSNVPDLPELTDQTIGDAHLDKGMVLPDTFGEALSRAEVLAGSEYAYLQLNVGKELELSGTLSRGIIQERFPLNGKAFAGKITVGLDSLKALCKSSDTFILTPKVLILQGKTCLSLISSHGDS